MLDLPDNRQDYKSRSIPTDGTDLYGELGVCPDLCCTVTPVMMSHESTGAFPGRESLSQWVQTLKYKGHSLPKNSHSCPSSWKVGSPHP